MAYGGICAFPCPLSVSESHRGETRCLIVALILDATMARMLLVPAVMRLLGDANWWAPAPLCRFYARHGIHEDDGPAPGAVQAPAPAPVGT